MSQFFGALMNVATRLLELDGEGMHPFQVLFVRMGMTPAQALKAATTEPAAMLGMEKSLGAVAPGFYADIVAVEGDPLTNITAASRRENIRWVMKSGRVMADKTRATGP